MANNLDVLWLLSHVDDLLLLTNNESLLKMIHDYLTSVYFKATLETKLSSHLGLKFQRLSNKDMFVSQPDHICHMLRTLDMENAPPASAPVSSAPVPENSPLISETQYRQIIGLLNYLACHTRPDLLCPVSMLASHCCAPTEWYLQQARQVVRYVKATRELGILFKYQGNEELKLFASADGTFNTTNNRSIQRNSGTHWSNGDCAHDSGISYSYGLAHCKHRNHRRIPSCGY